MRSHSHYYTSQNCIKNVCINFQWLERNYKQWYIHARSRPQAERRMIWEEMNFQCTQLSCQGHDNCVHILHFHSAFNNNSTSLEYQSLYIPQRLWGWINFEFEFEFKLPPQLLVRTVKNNLASQIQFVLCRICLVQFDLIQRRVSGVRTVRFWLRSGED